MQSFKCSLAVAATLVCMIPSIGIAEYRGISTDEPLACNSLCRWWMAQGKPVTEVIDPVVEHVSVPPALGEAVPVPSGTPARRRSVPVVALRRKPTLQRSASAALSPADKLIAAIPPRAVRRPDPALSARRPASPVAAATMTWPPSPVSRSSSVWMAADRLPASPTVSPPSTLILPSGESAAHDRLVERVEPAQMRPGAIVTIDRPIRTLAGRIEASAVIACVVAMMTSFKRRSLPLRWSRAA